MTDKTALIEAAFRTLERYAARGERCPMNGCHGITSHFVRALADDGRIKVEVYAHNYRRVVILKGEHRGKSTAKHPDGIKPWMVLDHTGTKTRRRPPVRYTTRPQPSLPRIG